MQEYIFKEEIESRGDEYDLICVGFGPASLAIAIALQDSDVLKDTKVLFLEKQNSFVWHAGMLLPGSRMQISFVKDLATLRNPRSEYTFINYLHQKDRLLQFLNLGTFLPLREEYNDYMKWCAQAFHQYVSYGEEVTSVDPVKDLQSMVDSFLVSSTRDGKETSRRARHVIVAVGGRPSIPAGFPSNCARVVHSSKYASAAPKILSDPSRDYNIAVVGGGQSAAEIFADLHNKYPNATVSLYIRSSALRPSDDSPFVNEIFNPERVDDIFLMEDVERQTAISEDRATNYGVVRLELIERIYDEMYSQRLRTEDQSRWKFRICPRKEITNVQSSEDGEKVQGVVKDLRTGKIESTETFDMLFFATGYRRDMHERMLSQTKPLMPSEHQSRTKVNRDYSVVFDRSKVSSDAGIWLQGCNEATHGLSDTLLSILSVRAGEIVNSIFHSKLNDTSITQNGYHTPPAEKETMNSDAWEKGDVVSSLCVILAIWCGIEIVYSFIVEEDFEHARECYTHP